MRPVLLTDREVASFLGIKPIKKFNDDIVDKGLIGFYSINGQKRFTYEHINKYLAMVEYKPKY